LVVDDNTDTLETISGLSNHFDIINTVELSTIMKILYHEKIDLLVLDMMIPKISGFDLCKLLKQNEDTKHIPIIFLTEAPNFEDIQKGFDLGAIDYIVKPFSSKEFVIRTTNHLELNSYRTELEKKVEQTLSEYKTAQKLLLQKSKQAELGELIMHIAHQWKQPLSELGSINNYLMAKRELKKTITTLEYGEILDKNAQIINFMSQTVNTFQNFYKPNFNSEQFSVNEAIESAYDLVNATFDYYDIAFSSNINEVITTYGNKNEFSQIILALLINSKNVFLKRLTLEPEITINLIEENDGYTISIQDNGGGIEEEKLKHIFDPFISDESTGMGLFMVKTICEKYNWNIIAHNKNGGAEFLINFKREKE